LNPGTRDQTIDRMDHLIITDMSWRGLPAWRISGNRLSAVVSGIGGHLAALTGTDDTLNPLWEPHWAAGDPAAVRPGSCGPWGAGLEAPLLAAIAGSNLCIPVFGDPPAGRDLPVHGDAGVSRWSRVAGTAPDLAAFAVRTPVSGLAIERRLRLVGEELELTTSVRHDQAGPLELDWCEHTTLGGTFLDGLVVTAGIDAVWTPEEEPEPAALPRFAGRGRRIEPAAALAIPADGDPPCGDVLAGRVAEGWWEASNQRLGRRLTARWERDAFPWLTLWTQHRERRLPPWDSRERTRGMEMSSKPFPEPRSCAGADGTWQGRPVLCSVPPGAGLTRTVRFNWARI
jgi:hypothetical protein